METLKNYLALFGCQYKFCNWRSVFMLSSTMYINNALFLVIWYLFFQKVPSLEGWVFEDVCLLYANLAVGYGVLSVFAGGSIDLMTSIVSGRVDRVLQLPGQPLLLLMLRPPKETGFGDIFLGLSIWLFLGASWQSILLYTLTSFGIALVFLGVLLIFASIVLFLPKLSAALEQIFIGILVSGAYPIHGMPWFMTFLFVTVIPIAYLGYFPTLMLTESSFEYFSIFMTGAFGYLGFGLIAFHFGLKHYQLESTKG